MSSIWDIMGSRSRSLQNLQSLIILFSKLPADGSLLQIVIPVIAKDTKNIIIVAFLENAFLENVTIGYSLESVCVCVCVCVFLHDNSKRNRSRNTKSECIVVYENSSSSILSFIGSRSRSL